ncbi:MAG: ParB/RepB/Spo0J family partition protein, partial [Paludibacteraceae bacterium]|nr:ParB/RepB/Spo0J family partition protein [Paludibacteraceae bacterium]
MKKSLGLGRGLDALIDTTHIATAGSSSISEIALDKIYPNPDQPRRTFDEEALQELAQSIKEHGVISPITLRKDADKRYMIIAGERRFRASKMAGLSAIPAYIRTAKDEQVMEWALIENIQREDLDAIEIALAYQ